MGDAVKRFSGFARSALRKLDALNAARTLNDLAATPGNRLEGLKGNRKINIRSGSTSNGAFVLSGLLMVRTGLRSWTITEAARK
jgi:hypothetical protein